MEHLARYVLLPLCNEVTLEETIHKNFDVEGLKVGSLGMGTKETWHGSPDGRAWSSTSTFPKFLGQAESLVTDSPTKCETLSNNDVYLTEAIDIIAVDSEQSVEDDDDDDDVEVEDDGGDHDDNDRDDQMEEAIQEKLETYMDKETCTKKHVHGLDCEGKINIRARAKQVKAQVIATTVVASYTKHFYQRDCTLTPVLVMCKRRVQVCLYDCVTDVLAYSVDVPYPACIYFIWIMLHYRY